MSTGRRIVQFVVSCIVLGFGVGLLLTAAFGSDGFSTLVNGISLTTHVPFVAVNCIVSAGFVAVAWTGGLHPSWATIGQPVLVGATITIVLAATDTPDSWVVRGVLLVVAFPIVVVGVAGYLGSGAGAGPTEAAVLAFDPPIPFRWSYSVLQGGSALVGWLLGAALGVGTLLVIFVLGPAVHLVSSRVRGLDIHASGVPTTSRTAPRNSG